MSETKQERYARMKSWYGKSSGYHQPSAYSCGKKSGYRGNVGGYD